MEDEVVGEDNSEDGLIPVLLDEGGDQEVLVCGFEVLVQDLVLVPLQVLVSPLRTQRVVLEDAESVGFVLELTSETQVL